MDNIPVSISLKLLKEDFEDSLKEIRLALRDLSRDATALGQAIDTEMNASGISLSQFAKSSEQISDKLKGNTLGITENIREINSQISSYKKYLSDVSSLSERQQFELGGQTSAVKGYIEQLEQQKEKLLDIAGAYEDVNDKYTDSVKKHDDLKAHLQMVRKEMESMVSAAVQSGDTTKTNAVKASKAYKDLQEDAKKTAASINEINKALSDDGPTLLFTSEEDYNRVKELKAEIADLQEQLSNTTDDSAFLSLSGQILDLQKALDGLNAKASGAASELGADLGKKAAEASSNLYELNATVKENEKQYEDLSKQCDEAKDKIKAASEAGDIQAVKDLEKEYQELTARLQEAGYQLNQSKGEQKDAESAWESLDRVLKGANGNIGTAVQGLRNLAVAAKGGTNPVQIFKAALSAVSAGAKLSTASFKALWATLKANPVGFILGLISALVSVVTLLISKMKSAAEKQQQLNAVEKAHLDLLEQLTENGNRGYDRQIAAKERELSILKAGNHSLSEQYKLEDEILRLKQEKAQQAAKKWKEESENIDENTKALERQQKALQALQLRSDKDGGGDMSWRQVNKEMEKQGLDVRYERTGFLGFGRKKLMVDGVEVSKGAVDAMLAAVQGQVDNTGKKIEMGIKVVTDEADVNAEAAQLAEERAEKARAIQRAETAEVQSATSARIALIRDGYDRDVKAAEAASANKITELKRRLREEVDLTTTARQAINEQILSEEKALQQKLEELEAAHQAKLLSIRRQIEDESTTSAPKNADMQRAELKRDYDRRIEDIDIRVKTDKNLSQEEIEELLKLKQTLEERYAKESELLEQKLEARKVSIAQEGVELELEAAEAGSAKELELKLKQLELQRQAEILANKQLPDDEQQSEDAINKKYQKLRQDELKTYYSSLLGDYAGFQQEMTTLTESYEKKRAEIESQITTEQDPKKKKNLQAALKELEKTYKTSLKSLQQEFVKNNIGDVFNEQTVENVKEAKRALDEMESMSLDDFNLAYNAQLSAEQFEKLKEQIRKVREELREMGTGYTIKEAFEDAFSGKTKEATERGVNYLVNGLTKVSNIVGGLADAMRDFADATENAKLESMADTFDGIAGTISTAGSYAAAGAQIGGVWGAVIGAVLGVGQGVVTGILDAQTKQAEAEKARREEAQNYLDEVVSGIGNVISSIDSLSDTIASLDYTNYRKSLLEAINGLKADADYDSTSNWNSLKNGAGTNEQMANALLEMFDLPTLMEKGIVKDWIGEGQDRVIESINRIFGDLGWGTITPAGYQSVSEKNWEKFQDIINRWEEATEEEKEWATNYYKNNNIISSSTYADIANGVDYDFDQKRLEILREMTELYESGSLSAVDYFNLQMKADKLSLDMLKQRRAELIAEGKNTTEIDNEIAEAAYNMGESVREMFEGLAGTDIQSIVDNWLDIFKEFGNDFESAIDKINESIDDMIRNMVIQTVFVQPLLQRLSRYLQEYAENAGLEQDEDGNYIWTNEAFRGMAEGLKSQVAGAKELYQQLSEELSLAGLGWGDSENDRSASNKGIANASQESVDELNGRMTAVQGHTFSINENTILIQQNVAAIMGSVRQIEDYTEHLVRIDHDIHEMHQAVNDIQGLKVRMAV